MLQLSRRTTIFSDKLPFVRLQRNYLQPKILPTISTMPFTKRWSSSSGGNREQAKVQFPVLPKEWQGRFVKGQMYKHQDSLPKLPVPPVQQSLKKYLDGIKCFLSDEDYKRTQSIVTEFGRPGGVGEMLQKKLQERAEVKDSWLIEWWNQVAYLGYREPVVVNSNPAVGFPVQPSGSQAVYVETISKFILATLKWNLIIQNEAVPPDVYRKRPMCMAQYDLFSTCRIPKIPVDVSQQTPFSESRHVVLVRNGHFFKLDVIYECPDGTLALAPPSHVMSEVRKVLDSAPETCEHPVGVLTTEHRDNWTKTREEMLLDPVNASSLHMIESAQGVFCLDRGSPPPPADSSVSQYWDPVKTMLANRYLHGNGCSRNSCNRWFDSAIQLFFGEDGGAGSNLEHSAADGPCAVSLNLFTLDLLQVQDVLQESSPVPESSLQPFQPLHWNITPKVASDIEAAKSRMDSLSGDVDLQVATYTDFGKGFPKQMKMSPDGFVQNAILLTYYKIHGELTAMYESGGTRWYKYGRTDTIRNTTSQAHTFIKAMSSSQASATDKAKALVDAIDAHSQTTVESIEGQVFDRHLLGLRLIAMENNIEMPAIFTDPSYAKSVHFCLSTSQVPVPNHEIFLCFGAVVPDGYGVCYNPQESQFILSVSSFHSNPKTNSHFFLKKLTETMGEMREVLVAAKGLNAKL